MPQPRRSDQPARARPGRARAKRDASGADVDIDGYVVDEARVAEAILHRSAGTRRDDPDRDIEARLELARDAFDVDMAMLTEIVEQREVARCVVGDWPGVAIRDLRGASLPLEDTFCRRLLEGRIPPVITDVRGDERVCDLVMAKALGVGAWMGVPLRTPDARLYLLCCLAREARPALSAGDVMRLRGFAVSVGVALEVAGPPSD
jgi:GAF domain-containing protein